MTTQDTRNSNPESFFFLFHKAIDLQKNILLSASMSAYKINTIQEVSLFRTFRLSIIPKNKYGKYRVSRGYKLSHIHTPNE